MHTVDLLNEALDVARELGYVIRQEWLGGSGGGACEVHGRRLLFLDLAMGPVDQLERVLDAIRLEVRAPELPLRPELRQLLSGKRAA